MEDEQEYRLDRKETEQQGRQESDPHWDAYFSGFSCWSLATKERRSDASLLLSLLSDSVRVDHSKTAMATHVPGSPASVGGASSSSGTLQQDGELSILSSCVLVCSCFSRARCSSLSLSLFIFCRSEYFKTTESSFRVGR
jgi:hypothetical protein